MINIPSFFKVLKPHLNERTRRLVAAALTVEGERGVASEVSKKTGVSFREIRRGLSELYDPPLKSPSFRKKGGGRKTTKELNPGILEAIKSLIDSTTRGDPESPLLWTCKSLRNLAKELINQGFKVSYHTVWNILEDLGYSLQSNRKLLEGTFHPDRNAQFECINKITKSFIKTIQPVISIDCKKQVVYIFS
jgi:transposase